MVCKVLIRLVTTITMVTHKIYTTSDIAIEDYSQTERPVVVVVLAVAADQVVLAVPEELVV